MQVQLTPLRSDATYGAPTWTVPSTAAATGVAVLANSVSTDGAKVLYYYGLPAGVPLDSTIEGIEFTTRVQTVSGTFTGETLNAALGIFNGPQGTPLALSATLTVSLSGLASGFVTFGGPANTWSKAYWTRKELMWGTPESQFGVWLGRVGVKGIQLDSPRFTVYYSTSSTLTGSRVPAPDSGLPLEIATKVDGSGELSAIKSEDVNQLGDALYAIEKSSYNLSDLTNDVKAVGGSPGVDLVASTVYVSGFLKAGAGTAFYEELVMDSGGVRRVVSNPSSFSSASSAVPTLPPGKESRYDYLAGEAWIKDAAGQTYPAYLTPVTLAIKRLADGSHYHRLSFRLDAAEVEQSTTRLSFGGYDGIHLAQSHPLDALPLRLELPLSFNVPSNTAALPGMESTQTSATSPPTDPQPFRASVVYDSDTGVQTESYVLYSHDGRNPAGGYKWARRKTDYDLVEFDVASLFTYDVEYDRGSTPIRSLIRAGFLLHASGSTASASGYGLMISNGQTQTTSSEPSPVAVARFVRLNGVDLTKAYPLGLTFTDPGHYTVFPWNSGTTLTHMVSGLWAPIQARTYVYRFKAVRRGNSVDLSLGQYNPSTGVETTLMSTTDVSGFVGTRAGFFGIKPANDGATTATYSSSWIELNSVKFGFSDGLADKGALFEARILGLGRMTNVVV